MYGDEQKNVLEDNARDRALKAQTEFENTPRLWAWSTDAADGASLLYGTYEQVMLKVGTILTPEGGSIDKLLDRIERERCGSSYDWENADTVHSLRPVMNVHCDEPIVVNKEVFLAIIVHEGEA